MCKNAPVLFSSGEPITSLDSLTPAMLPPFVADGGALSSAPVVRVYTKSTMLRARRLT